MGSVNENVNVRIREDGSRVVAKNIRGIGTAATDAEEGLLNMKTVLLGLVSGATIMGLAHMADEFTNIQNRLRLVTTGSANLARVTAELGSIANQTRSDFSSTAELYSRMALSSKELGLSQKDLLNFTKSLNQAVILSGASAEEAAGGIRQLSQGMASGTLRGEELNSVLENLPMVADIIAKGLGVTRGELRQLGQDGKLTATQIIDAFKGAKDELDKGFATTVPTLGQSLTVLKNNFMLFVGEVDKSYGITAGLAKIIMTISNNIDILVPILAGVAVAIATAFAPAVIMAFAAQVEALWALMLANPFVAVAALVLGVATALYTMRDAIKIGIDDTTTLGDLMRALWENMSQWIMDVAETARGLWNLLTDGGGKSASAMSLAFHGAAKSMGDDFDSFFADSGTGFAGLLRSVARTMDAIVGFIAGVAVFGKKAIGQMVDYIIDLFHKAQNAAADFAETFANRMIDASNSMREAVGLDPFEHVKFDRVATEGADKFKDMGALWAESMDEGFESFAGKPGTPGVFEGALDDLLKQAQDIGKARLAAAGATGNLAGGGPPQIKSPVDEDALKRAAKALEQLKNALRGVLDEADPVGAATRRLAESHDTLTRAVKAHLISEEEAVKVYEQLKFQMRDQLDPLGALNREIDDNIKLLKMGNDQRQIEAQMMRAVQDLQMQGKTLTEAETAALRAKLTVEQELAKISQAKDSMRADSSAGKMEEFQTQLEAMKELLASADGARSVDLTGQLSSMFPWANLEGTAEQMAAFVQQHADMYAQIKALEDAQVISHETANSLMRQNDVNYLQQRLQQQRDFFSTLAGLSGSSNKKLAAIGKAAAITTATIDGVIAVQKALAAPPGWPYNAPNVIAVGVMQAANVAAIASQGTGFRTGGEFTVGGMGGPDSQTVAFRATPGEKVRVNTPAQDRALRNGGEAAAPVINQKHITIVDPALMLEAINTPEGEEVFWHVASKNPERLRALVGN